MYIKNLKVFVFLGLIISCSFIVPGNLYGSSLLRRGRMQRIEEVGLLQPEEWRLGAGVRYESRRTAAKIDGENLKYNNTRLHPLSLQVGLLNTLEVGALLGYSFNSQSNSLGYPNSKGLEGLTLQARVQWHRYFGSSVRVKFTPDDELQPYGGDRVGLQINFPIEFPLADGMFHGEAGYTFQGGGFYDGSGNRVADWGNSFNMGLGYKWSDGRFMTYSVELVGHTAVLDDDAENVDPEDYLELLFGATVHLSPQTRVLPSLGLGLLEGSPDLSAGFKYEMDFGHPPRLEREKPALPARYSRRRPVGGPEEEVDDVYAVPEDERDATKQERIRNLKEQARRAYQRGDYDAAIASFRQVILLEPDDAVAHANLGSLYYRQRDFSRARDHYRRAVQLDPTNFNAQKYLGAAYYQLGEWDDARRRFRRALELEPDDQQVRQWLRQIQ